MNIVISPSAEKDLSYFRKNNPNILRKIVALLENISDTPFAGKGKPEPLKFQLSGCWSRRITNEHRLVYKVQDNKIFIISCRYHY